MASVNAIGANAKPRSRHARCPIRPPFPEVMANRGAAELLLDEDDVPKKPKIAPAIARGKKGLSAKVLPSLGKLTRNSSSRSHLGPAKSSNEGQYAGNLLPSKTSKPWNTSGMKPLADRQNVGRRGPRDSLHNRSPAVDWSMQVSPSDSIIDESEEGVASIEPDLPLFKSMASHLTTRPVFPGSARYVPRSTPLPFLETRDNEDDFELPYEEMKAFPYLPSMSMLPIETLPPDTSEEWETPPYTYEETKERARQGRLAEST